MQFTLSGSVLRCGISAEVFSGHRDGLGEIDLVYGTIAEGKILKKAGNKIALGLDDSRTAVALDYKGSIENGF